MHKCLHLKMAVFKAIRAFLARFKYCASMLLSRESEKKEVDELIG